MSRHRRQQRKRARLARERGSLARYVAKIMARVYAPDPFAQTVRELAAARDARASIRPKHDAVANPETPTAPIREDRGEE